MGKWGKASKLVKLKIGHRKLFIKWFWSYLELKMNVLSVWKGHFSVFCKFLIDEAETNFWESEAKHQKLFNSKFGHRKLLRKWFWSYLELKNECSEHFNRAFFSFLQIFEWRSWNRFLGKRGNAAKTFCIKSALFGAFWKIIFSFDLVTLINLCYNF